MPRIGKVLSPEVAAGLIRRGESHGGSFIRRAPDTRTTLPADPAAELAMLREERLLDQAERDEARALRGEDFTKERFEFQKSEAKKNRIERGEEREGKVGKRDAESEARSMRDARSQGQKILEQMGSLLRHARKPNPDTGQADPDALSEAQAIAQAMWERFQALPLPEEEKQAALEAMRALLPTTPAPRAGAQAPQAQGLEPPSPFRNEQERFEEIGSRVDARNPDPMTNEQIEALPIEVLSQVPQGAMLHADGTMTTAEGQRVPIPGLNRSQGGGAGGSTGYVDPTLGAEIGIPTRTP